MPSKDERHFLSSGSSLWVRVVWEELLWDAWKPWYHEVTLERKSLPLLHTSCHSIPLVIPPSVYSTVTCSATQGAEITGLNIDEGTRRKSSTMKTPYCSSVPWSQDGQLCGCYRQASNSSSWGFSLIRGTFWNHWICVVNIYSKFIILSLLLLLSLFLLPWHGDSSHKYPMVPNGSQGWTPCLSLMFQSNCHWLPCWHCILLSLQECS